VLVILQFDKWNDYLSSKKENKKKRKGRAKTNLFVAKMTFLKGGHTR
jgi:hypothetical protein